MKQILDQLLDGKDLSRDEAFDAMLSIMSGEFDDAQIAGFLMVLRAKGETVDEITGFAHAMRKKMVKVSLSHPAIDMCGTGGDSSGTFNISTAATFLVAGAGVHVAKHGNRSMTSKSGSADVLQALGIPINLAVEKSAENIDSIGLGFMFAPAYHPAMKYAIGARKSLATRTVFNILGPLCNPADVKAQAMGIFDPNLTEHIFKLYFDTKDLDYSAYKNKVIKVNEVKIHASRRTFGRERSTSIAGGDPPPGSNIVNMRTW